MGEREKQLRRMVQLRRIKALFDAKDVGAVIRDNAVRVDLGLTPKTVTTRVEAMSLLRCYGLAPSL